MPSISARSVRGRHWFACWAVGLAMLAAFSCTDDGAALATLRASGYTNIRLTGYDWFGCSKDDGTCTGFEATGPTGVRTHGAVGCGFWSCSKGCTVRVGQ
jgi:hypothetical protein